MEASLNKKVSLVKTLIDTLKKILTNPLTIGVILGFIANLTNLKLPLYVETAIFKIAGAALPIALFGLGGLLVSYKITSQMPQVSFTCFIKLMLYPLLSPVN